MRDLSMENITASSSRCFALSVLWRSSSLLRLQWQLILRWTFLSLAECLYLMMKSTFVVSFSL